MRSFVLVACAACSNTEQHPTATVVLYNVDHVALEGWRVVFHGDDGRVLDVQTTDRFGEATGAIEPNGLVTYAAPFLAETIITHGHVQPGDRLINAPPLPPATGHTFAVTPSDVPPSATLCQLAVPCRGHVFEVRRVPGAELAVEMPPDCSETYLLTATDNRYERIAFAFNSTVFRTDFIDVSPHIEVDAATRLDAVIEIDGAPIWRVVRDNSLDVKMPAGIPGVASYRFEAQTATDERSLEQPLGLDAAPLLPRITDSAYVYPSITFTTEAPLYDFTIDVILTSPAGQSWTLVDFDGTLPELPAGFLGFVPADLELHAVGATVRTTSPKGEITRKTARPLLPRLRELPL